MRITKEMLLKIASDTVTARVRADRSVTAVYLHGTLLDSEPLLGGTADIDLCFIHDETPSVEREIVRISDEICLDIFHHAQQNYRQARELRTHPWLGPTLYGCKALYDPQHFLDFVQATVRGQFYRPENVLRRARRLSEQARQVWLELSGEAQPAGPEKMALYLHAVEQAVNAAISLLGAPLTERRFLLNLPPRAHALGKPGVYAAVIGLLGGGGADIVSLRAWLEPWQTAFLAAGNSSDDAYFRVHRLPYYRRAFEALLAGDQPLAVLWPLWRSWTACVQQSATAEAIASWRDAGNVLGILGEQFTGRVAALDAFLDQVDDILETWARQNGA